MGNDEIDIKKKKNNLIRDFFIFIFYKIILVL